MVQNPCVVPVAVAAADAVVRGVGGPAAVVAVAEAHRGVAAVAVAVDAEVRAAAADKAETGRTTPLRRRFLSGRQD